jgi:glycosyltransferase involved in cell wall biosynthesis
MIPGVSFYYLWPWRFSALGRLWIKTLGCAFFLALCFRNKYDAIYVRELEANPFPRWCSIVFRIPLYVEVNSILLQNIEMTGGIQNQLTRVERYQAADFEQARGLIVPSFPRCRWIIDNYGINPNKVHMIVNGTYSPIEQKLDRSTTLRKLNLPEDTFYLGFLGNIWRSYDLATIVEAIDFSRKQIPNLSLIVIGGGPGLKNLQNLAEAKGLESKIVILGYVQPELLFKIVGAVDVGLMNLTRKALQDLGPITTRFATYAAFRIPVIANNMYLKNYPSELTEGLATVPPEDPHALANMILWLFDHPEERKYKAKLLHDFVIKNLTWESVTKEILDIIRADTNLNGKVISKK